MMLQDSQHQGTKDTKTTKEPPLRISKRVLLGDLGALVLKP
jgi:hypothetical protein